MKKGILVLMLIFVSALQAQQKFTLQQTLQYALEHNRTAKNASSNIEAAKWKKWEATSIGLPQINGKIEYQRWIKQQFPGVDFNEDGFIDFGAKQSLIPSVTLNQLIFDGSYIVGLQSAKVFLDISKNAKAKTDREISKSVTAAYSNILLIKEGIKIVRKNIKNLQQNITETSKILENGLTEEENLEQLEITLNDLKNNENRLTKVYQVSISLLKLLMGLDETKVIALTDNLDDLSNAILEPKGIFKKSFSVFSNIDYKIAENDVEANKLLYKLERYKKLPSISAFITGNYIANSNNFSFFDSKQKWVHTSLVGVNLEIPIFTSFQGKAKRKQAKLKWEASQNKLEEIKLQTGLNIRNALIELELAQNTLLNKRRNLALAERIERKNNIKYKEGIASSFELREAQQQLYDSQNKYLQSMVEVINKKAELESLTK